MTPDKTTSSSQGGECLGNTRFLNDPESTSESGRQLARK